MRFLKQFLIIVLMTFLGEVLRYMIPLPIPAGIYGMTLLFLALEFGLIKVSDVKETSSFLIEIMPVMFIPAGVGILSNWGAIADIWPKLVVVVVVSTVVVMAAAGGVTQLLMKRKGRSE